MTHEFVDPYCYTYRHVSAADCKKRNSKYNWEVLIPQVQELLDKGMTVAEIAKELSINSHSLHTRLRRYPLEKEGAEI